MDKAEIRACLLADLGLTAEGCNTLVRDLKLSEDPNFQFGYGNTRRSNCRQLAQEYTAENAINFIDTVKLNQWFSKGCSWCDLDQLYKTFIERLVELGMTQLDWIELPNSTITLEMVAKLGKKKLWEQSVLLLKAPSNVVIRKLESIHEKPAPEVTIEDLLATTEHALDEVASNCARSLSKTRATLKLLGFKYEDGIFLRENTQRYLAETLVKQEGVSRKTAQKVVEIAIHRGWVSGFAE